MGTLELRDIDKVYRSRGKPPVHAVRSLNMDIEKGERQHSALAHLFQLSRDLEHSRGGVAIAIALLLATQERHLVLQQMILEAALLQLVDSAGERIGVHCRGSIGRATVATACILIHLGWDAQTALAAIAHARGVPVPDTPEQECWILEYEAKQ